MTVCAKAFPGPGLVVLALGQVGGRSLVEIALLSSNEPVTAPIRDIAELGHVNVDQRAWMVVLVATQWLASDSVDPGEPIDPTPHQDRVHGRCRHPELAGNLNRTEAVTPPQPHDQTHQDGLATTPDTKFGVLFGACRELTVHVMLDPASQLAWLAIPVRDSLTYTRVQLSTQEGQPS